MKAFLIFLFFIIGKFLNAQDGVLDVTFGTDGVVETSSPIPGSTSEDALLMPDGKFIIAGNTYSDGGHIELLKYDANGMADSSFGIDGIAVRDFASPVTDEAAYCIALQSDGKIVTGGAYTQMEGTSHKTYSAIHRFNSDGSTDSSFGINGVIFLHVQPHGEMITDIVIQSDDKIIACAGSDDYYGIDNYIAFRMEPNGEIDSSFGENGYVYNSFAGLENFGRTLLLQPDGKLLIGGRSNRYFGIARYLPDGVIDSAFGTVGKILTEFNTYSAVYDLAVQPDGKIIAYGYTSIYEYGPGEIAIARYNADGSTDYGFGTDGIIIKSPCAISVP